MHSNTAPNHDYNLNDDILPSFRLNFLFLVRTKLLNEQLWNRFFSNINHNKYSVYIHCSSAQCDVHSQNLSFPKVVVPTVPSAWCSDLVTAMNELLRVAIWNGTNMYTTSHTNVRNTNVRNKYVFLSENAIAIKPFNSVYNALQQDNVSHFCIAPVSQWAPTIGPIEMRMIKTHQCVILNEPDARRSVLLWNTKTAAKFREMLPSERCVDEFWHAFVVYGTVNISNTEFLYQMGIEMNRDTEEQGTCDTFVFWRNYFSRSKRNIMRTMSGRLLAANVSFAANHEVQLNLVAADIFRNSTFLFMRKFVGQKQRSVSVEPLGEILYGK